MVEEIPTVDQFQLASETAKSLLNKKQLNLFEQWQNAREKARRIFGKDADVDIIWSEAGREAPGGQEVADELLAITAKILYSGKDQ